MCQGDDRRVLKSGHEQHSLVDCPYGAGPLRSRLSQQACEPSGGLQFVCGPKNAEDLVLVPGTQWILSSGMAEGASFFQIDSRNGAWRPLKFESKPDAAFSTCASPPALATFQTHGLSIREAGRGLSRLLVVGHGAREAIEVFDVAVGTDGPRLPGRAAWRCRKDLRPTVLRPSQTARSSRPCC